MKTLVLFLSLLITAPITQQPTHMTPLNQVYECYLTDTRQLWNETISGLNASFRASAYKDEETLYALVLAQYGLMGAIYGDKPRNTSLLYKTIDQTERSTKRLLTFHAYKSQANAFLAAITAMRVGLNPMRALTIGSKSDQHIREAIRLNPKNPTAWVEKGNLKYHSPPIFGGNMREAVSCFEQAVELFDEQPALRKDNWLYLHAMAWLGKSYEKVGKKEKAIAIYEKAIAYESRFLWVKEELLPRVKRMR